MVGQKHFTVFKRWDEGQARDPEGRLEGLGKNMHGMDCALWIIGKEKGGGDLKIHGAAIAVRGGWSERGRYVKKEDRMGKRSRKPRLVMGGGGVP